jgi:hypothetical protein
MDGHPPSQLRRTADGDVPRAGVVDDDRGAGSEVFLGHRHVL